MCRDAFEEIFKLHRFKQRLFLESQIVSYGRKTRPLISSESAMFMLSGHRKAHA